MGLPLCVRESLILDPAVSLPSPHGRHGQPGAVVLVQSPPKAGPEAKQAAAAAQLPHVQAEASGREEATEELAWPPAFSRAVAGAEPAWLSRQA